MVVIVITLLMKNTVIGIGLRVNKSFKPSSFKQRLKTRPVSEHNYADMLELQHKRSSSRWTRLSKLCRSISPLCPCGLPARSVHHVKMAIRRPDLFFDLSNLISVCDFHHKEVSMLESKKHFVEAIDLYEDIAKATAKEYYENLI